MKVAPIILFAFKRPNELTKVVNALKENTLSENSELYIFIDGPRTPSDLPKVEEVRHFCNTITGFKEIHRMYYADNHGCANSIIRGVSSVLEKHESAIIVEDDVVTSQNFLVYMNQALDFYEEKGKVFSISGHCLPFKKPSNYQYDAFLFPRSGSWGWGTWSDRWFSVDWTVSDYLEFKRDKKARKAFKYSGTDLVKMLDDCMEGKIDAWDIRFTYSQFQQQKWTLYPAISKVDNIGFSNPDATHTHVYNRYQTIIDKSNQTEFSFPVDLVLNESYVKQFRSWYTILARVKGRIKTALGMR